MQDAISGYPVLGESDMSPRRITSSIQNNNKFDFFSVEYCSDRLSHVQAMEYVSLENNKYLSTSSPEECCMTCYYMASCSAWQYHNRFQMCSQLLGSVSPNAMANSNFVSSLKPVFSA